MIGARDLAELLVELEPIGLSGHGTSRLAWTPEHEASAEWFAKTAARFGLQPERDPAGNLWACPDAPAPWWAVGSHLDSVRDGGRLDGALGVAAGFAIAAASRVPLAVISSRTRRARATTRPPSEAGPLPPGSASMTSWTVWTRTACASATRCERSG